MNNTPKIHAKGIELVGAGQGFSLCGVYRLDLADDHKFVTCRNCLKMLTSGKTKTGRGPNNDSPKAGS